MLKALQKPEKLSRADLYGRKQSAIEEKASLLFGVRAILTSNHAINGVQQIFKLMASNLCIDLIEFDSRKLDAELENECPSILASPALSPPASHQYVFQECQSREESFRINEEDCQLESSREEGLSACIETNFSASSAPCRKTRAIKKRKDRSGQAAPPSAGKRGRKGSATKATYPTKNFLPNFKGPHLCFLERQMGGKASQHSFVQYLRNKDGISLKDYETLYKMEEFEEALKTMFRCRFLYRELLLSRSDPETKKIHQRKLHVFEEAFQSKAFTKIN